MGLFASRPISFLAGMSRCQWNRCPAANETASLSLSRDILSAWKNCLKAGVLLRNFLTYAESATTILYDTFNTCFKVGLQNVKKLYVRFVYVNKKLYLVLHKSAKLETSSHRYGRLYVT